MAFDAFGPGARIELSPIIPTLFGWERSKMTSRWTGIEGFVRLGFVSAHVKAAGYTKRARYKTSMFNFSERKQAEMSSGWEGRFTPAQDPLLLNVEWK